MISVVVFDDLSCTWGCNTRKRGALFLVYKNMGLLFGFAVRGGDGHGRWMLRSRGGLTKDVVVDRGLD